MKSETLPVQRGIEANDRTIRVLLSGNRFGIDYYQREYRWQKKQVAELIADLTESFFRSYQPDDHRNAVDRYEHYFLGSVILSKQATNTHIIDGQQRLTTLTLILLYLCRRCPEAREQLSGLYHSKKFGETRFNIDVEDRTEVMRALMEGRAIEVSDANESSRNIKARFDDIEGLLQEAVDDAAIPYFIDWFTEKVHLVEIVAYSDEVAYTIFETMNDRGLSLTQVDMLKGFLLANVASGSDRVKATDGWRMIIDGLRKLPTVGGDEDRRDGEDRGTDAEFIKAWLRAQYAVGIRERQKKAEAGAWDLVGTEFHRWVREQAKPLGLEREGGCRDFITQDMARFARWFGVIRSAESKLTKGLEHVYYNASLQFTHQATLLLAALRRDDDEETCLQKIRLVSQFADIFLVRRLVNFKRTSYGYLQFTIHGIVQDIRGKSIAEISGILLRRLEDQDEGLVQIVDFHLNQWSGRAIKHILARMTDFVAVNCGEESRYSEYVSARGKSAYEVEHVWPNHPEHFLEEFPDAAMFDQHRNRIGGLLLLPKSFNASYGDIAYAEKRLHYFGQNWLAKSLDPRAYEHHPSFMRFIESRGLPFQPHETFKRADMAARQRLYLAIAEQIWNPQSIASFADAGERSQ